MSTPHVRLSGPAGGVHPTVLNRRIREVALVGFAGVVSLALALAIAVAVPKPNFLLVLGIIAGLLGIVALVLNTRLEISVAAVAIYLGCLDGPVKLLSSGGIVTSSLRNALILAVCLGVLMRILLSRQQVKLPALSGWVIAFTLVVLVEAFNPKTHGALKIVAGFRQQLQWVPFFFFGYMLMRSTARLRMLFILLGVIALANGVAATVQTQLSPEQIASWGPGYRERVFGTSNASARKYISEGQARVRPLGLGSDSGFGGGVGVIALPGTFALIATLRKRRWMAMVLTLGAMAAIATSLGRLQVGGGVLAVFAYAMLSASAGRRVTRPLVALMVILALALPIGAIFISAVGQGVFSRYSSISPNKVTTTATGYKEASLGAIPHELVSAPFGFGLATTGAVSGFGGKVTEEFEGHGVSSETQFNFLAAELGLLGLLVWTGFLIRLILLVIRRLRFVADLDLQVCLAAVFAPLIAFFLMSFDGPISASAAAGAYFWFAAGVAAYWLAGPGRALARTQAPRAQAIGEPAGTVLPA